jgi:hypothetical protein
MSNQQVNASDIRNFTIFPTNGGKEVDISAQIQELSYYENILSNSLTLSVIIADSGGLELDAGKDEMIGILDGIPIRGGERVVIKFSDSQDKQNTLSFSTHSFYINRIKNVSPGTSADVFMLELCTREFLANEQTRVVKRYDGKISDNVIQILQDPKGLKTKKNIDADSTVVPYNFIGNDRKPFYVCTWLATKGVPEESGKINGAAGYFFFETYDGFKFKSIDVLLDQKPKEIKTSSGKSIPRKYVYTNAPNIEGPSEYTGKIISVNIERDMDLQQNLLLGTYANRSLFFDYYAMDYEIRNYSLPQHQKDKIKIAADNISFVPEEFTQTPSRFMNLLLDLGTLPSGETADKQLETWKNDATQPNFDAPKIMVQAIMRYNQLYTIKTNIVIPGDFSLRAGDIIECDFPDLAKRYTKGPNKETKGKYLIASLCHRVTPKDTYTSLTLVRDSFKSSILKK